MATNPQPEKRRRVADLAVEINDYLDKAILPVTDAEGLSLRGLVELALSLRTDRG